MTTVQLHLGDCLDFMRTLPDGSVDAMITDPPYGIDFQSAWRIDKSQWLPKITNDKEPFVDWLPDSFRVLKEGGALVCFCRWDVEEAFRLAIGAAGFNVQSQIIWDKCAHGMGDLKASFAPQHENAWFATKGGFQFWGKRPKSVIRMLRVAPEDLAHPNEKPVGLMTRLVESIVKPRGVVADFFMGVGPVGVACQHLGRSFLGAEINADYFKIAQKRIAEAQLQYRMELA